MKDQLGDRIKDQYEDRTRMFLPRRTYTIIRVDGKAFHTLTRGFDRPFDKDLTAIMDFTAKRLCEEIQGARLAYVQSDEISILLTDFDSPNTCAWFDGNIQKIVSISAAIATATFNDGMLAAYHHNSARAGKSDGRFIKKGGGIRVAYFDSRAFTIPDPIEVENYFIWRQQDASRNSVQMVARSLYSHKELNGKSNAQLHDMIHEKGLNWNDFPVGSKRGRVLMKKTYEHYDVEDHGKYGNAGPVLRTRWETVEPPIFTQDRNFLRDLIPNIGRSDET